MTDFPAAVGANPRPPNFFIVGAPKAGTTALYAFLDQHPLVYMSPLKEPNYFSTELRLQNFVAAGRSRVAREMRALARYLHGDRNDIERLSMLTLVASPD
jgi:Sulfotransferase family